MGGTQARIQDFGQGGPEPKMYSQIGVFPLKLSENCMIWNKSSGQGGGSFWIRKWEELCPFPGTVWNSPGNDAQQKGLSTQINSHKTRTGIFHAGRCGGIDSTLLTIH